MTFHYRPRRTMLYVPAHTSRHIEKARILPTDSIIFDLQESVPPEYKVEAREILKERLQNAYFGYSEKVVRINPLESEWGLDDIKTIVSLEIDAVLFPRIESSEQLEKSIYELDRHGGNHLAIMVNIESPLGVLNAQQIAATTERISTIVMGTTDLANELKLNPTPDRSGLVTALSMVILAAKAYKRCIIDGPHFDLKNVEACEFSCRQARDLGFDGKTVIHPIQLDYTNDAFTPKQDDIKKAKAIIDAIEVANQQGKSMAVLEDRLIEPVLQEWAERVIAIHDIVHKLGQKELLGPEK